VIDQLTIHPVVAKDHALEIYSSKSDTDRAGFDLDRWCVATMQLFAKMVEIAKLARNTLLHHTPQKAWPWLIRRLPISDSEYSTTLYDIHLNSLSNGLSGALRVREILS
jgi:hypothetical protein